MSFGAPEKKNKRNSFICFQDLFSVLQQYKSQNVPLFYICKFFCRYSVFDFLCGSRKHHLNNICKLYVLLATFLKLLL